MIENSYLKSHIFLQKEIGIFFHNFNENSNEDIIILLFLSIKKFIVD